MRYLPTSKLTPGMALGQDIYDGEGRLLLAKHLLLSEEYISDLEFLGFPGIYIDDEFTQGIEIQQILNPQVRSQALKIVHDLFTIDFDVAESDANEIKIRKTVEHVVENILSNGDIMCNVLDIKNYDDYIYYHSINVGTLSAMMGARCGMKEEQLYQLTTAAILHDIGKRFIDKSILNSPNELTEEEKEAVYKHPKLGADFLKNNFHFPAIVYTSILQHHEAYNGDGYPLCRNGEEIPIYARIIKLTEAYDALTSKQPNRKAYSPSDAVEYLMSESGREFDPFLVNLFLEKIVVYPIGCEVVLSDGRHAIVVQNFQRFLLRPLVKVVDTGEMLNLKEDSESLNLIIKEMVM